MAKRSTLRLVSFLRDGSSAKIAEGDILSDGFNPPLDQSDEIILALSNYLAREPKIQGTYKLYAECKGISLCIFEELEGRTSKQVIDVIDHSKAPLSVLEQCIESMSHDNSGLIFGELLERLDCQGYTILKRQL